MIVKNKEICGGAPTIQGTRILVSVVLANIRDGATHDEICEWFNITEEDISDCLTYAVWD